MIYYESDHRPLVLTGGLSNKGTSHGTMYGLHRDWADEPPDFIPKPGIVYQHLKSIHPTEGEIFRTILRQPAGQLPGVVSFSQWHTLTNAQREIMKDDTNAWRSQSHQRKGGIFFRYRAENPFHRSIFQQMPIDPSNDKPWAALLQNFLPYYMIGYEEIWLDGGSSQTTKAEIKRLANLMAILYGIKVGVEAIPITDDFDLDMDFLKYVPAMGSWRYVWSRMIKKDKEWFIPAEMEVHVTFRKYDPSTGVPDPTQSDADYLKSLGFIISWSSLMELPSGEGASGKTPKNPNEFNRIGGVQNHPG